MRTHHANVVNVKYHSVTAFVNIVTAVYSIDTPPAHIVNVKYSAVFNVYNIGTPPAHMVNCVYSIADDSYHTETITPQCAAAGNVIGRPAFKAAVSANSPAYGNRLYGILKVTASYGQTKTHLHMKNTLRFALMAAALLLLITLSGKAFAAGGIKGTLTGAANNPLIHATVQAMQQGRTAGSAMTDINGHYLIKPLADGSYTVTFTYLNFRDSITNIRVRGGKIAVANKQWNTAAASLADKNIIVQRRALSRPMVDFKSAPAGSMSGGRAAYMNYESAPAPVAYFNPSTESYTKNPENDFMTVKASPLSTLSVDVDRASYSNIRRFINEGQRPPADAVRVEEMINYFEYNYPQPTGDDPVAITTEITTCPWNTQNKLLHIGLQARKIATEKLPSSNLIFLIDVSGSMNEPNKLPLLKASLKMLVNNLRAQDHVAIVVYAGNAGLVLPPTPGNEKAKIIDALESLSAGGSTAGGEGILLAYKTAKEHFIKGGNNRVILATDGDFNVGVSNDNELEELIVKQRGTGIFLTCLGYGMGNYKDAKMEVLADKGNGNYAYIDNIQEAQKTLVAEFGGTLFTVAKDVKAQVEFNPAKVQGYRLVGYENRVLNAEDFKDDKKDAAEMGAGHTVTILYEIIPAGIKSAQLRNTDELKYQQPASNYSSGNGELATVKFRYKAPDGAVSKELVHSIGDKEKTLLQTSENIRFAASVAMWGMLLKDSKYKGMASYANAILLAESARGNDKDGYRAECIRLMKSGSKLAGL